MMLTVCDRVSAHLQKIKEPQTHYNWFLINIGRMMN